MDVSSFFDNGLTNIDPAMRPFFGAGSSTELGCFEGSQMPMQDDPYPLMYLDDQLRAMSGTAASDFSQQGQYTAPAFANSATDAAPVETASARAPGQSPKSPSLTTNTSIGTANSSASTPQLNKKPARSKSGSVSGDVAEERAAAGAGDEPAKRRKQRRKSIKSSEDGDGEDPKRNVVLARNRVAALKCRKKKKEFVSDLEEQRADLEQKHQQLQAEYNTLLTEVASIKNHLLDHATCNDPHIDNWLGLEARRFVQTTKERYSCMYGNTDQLTYEELLKTAAPIGSALPESLSPASTHRGSVAESVVSSSARRNSAARSLGALSARNSPTIPNFGVSLSGNRDGDDV